jgi:hypothetical protein
MRSIHDQRICPSAWPAPGQLAALYSLSRIVHAAEAAQLNPKTPPAAPHTR